MIKKRVVFLCIIISYLNAHAQSVDINILKSINNSTSSFKNSYSKTISNLVTPVAITVPVGIALAGFITKDDYLKKEALFTAGSYITSALVTQTTKRIVQRKRPYETNSFIIQRTDADNGRSFPSGHTSAAFATATSVALRHRKWYYVVPAYLYATSAGWARMYQGVHYPSDVLAGAIVGAGSAWLGFYLQKKLNFHKPPPNPKF